MKQSSNSTGRQSCYNATGQVSERLRYNAAYIFYDLKNIITQLVIRQSGCISSGRACAAPLGRGVGSPSGFESFIHNYALYIYMRTVIFTFTTIASTAGWGRDRGLCYLISNLGGTSNSAGTYFPFFLRCLTHSDKRYSICPFTDRKSSSAHAAISSYNFFESRSGTCFFAFSAIAI